MNDRQQRMYSELQQTVKKRMGWRLISTDYINSETKLSFICPNNHPREMSPHCFKRGRGCAVCSKKDPITAKKEFEDRMRELKATIIGEYVNSSTPVDSICVRGHRCSPRPSSLQSGQGICIQCPTSREIIAEENYIINVMQQGGQIIVPYNGTHRISEVLCSEGHICYSRPGSVQQGYNICLECSRGRKEAKITFENKVVELGGRLISLYINSYTPVDVLCKDNHPCSVYPNSLQKGYALCKTCIGSSGEKLVASALGLLQLNYIREYRIPGKSFRYDFIVGGNTIIEWDGVQHFKFSNLFHKTTKDFLDKQNRDRQKIRDILDLGGKMIRIDHTWGKKSVEELARCIYAALQSDQKLIVSNPDMYQWLYIQDSS